MEEGAHDELRAWGMIILAVELEEVRAWPLAEIGGDGVGFPEEAVA